MAGTSTVNRTVSSPWYRVEDIMIIMEVKKSKAYQIISSLQKEISNTKIPGTKRFYSPPPAGRIRKDFFCEKYMLDVAECDAIIAKEKSA